jgi:cytochrome c-type biogenesis protein CcmF
VISILGRTLVLAALAFAAAGAVTGFAAGASHSPRGYAVTRACAVGFGVSSILANLLMIYALVTHDFSVHYVAEVGSRATPLYYTIISLWASLNGSILFWAGVLGLYVVALAVGYANKHREYMPYTLAVLQSVCVFFALLVASIANPFAPVSPVPLDGPGPNPLLQNHWLMAFHPPTLYIGYVGMVVPFAMGCGALLAGRLEAGWIAPLRRWTLVPWAFLTVAIMLGGWWSYEVLGWGGYWAWDPVENASFMPWLACTAFLHSAMVVERRGTLKTWSLVLLLSTFLLTLVGTFMTRSGVFNSVHSFTQSPIGPVFLGFLGVCLVGSVLLVAARVDAMSPPKEGLAGPASREMAFLGNNLLFAAFTFTVLIGTVYPLLNEAITGKQISVGQPYFDRMSAPIGIGIVFLMGVGPVLPWGRVEGAAALRRLAVPAVSAVVALGLGLLGGQRSGWVLATIALSGFALGATVLEVIEPARARARALGEGLGTAFGQVLVKARRRYGGYIVHVGVLIIAVAHAVATATTEKTTVTLIEGGSTQVGEYALTYLGAESLDEPHRRSLVARFGVSRAGEELGVLAPRLNHYKTLGQPIGTPEVRSGLDEDLYLSLINVDPVARSASVDVLIEPLVWWLWFGGGVMSLGTVVAAWPARRRTAAVVAPAAAAVDGVPS